MLKIGLHSTFISLAHSISKPSKRAGRLEGSMEYNLKSHPSNTYATFKKHKQNNFQDLENNSGITRGIYYSTLRKNFGIMDKKNGS